MSIVKHILHRFQRADDGAVTVDWVVLTASVVGLGMAVGALIWAETETINNKVVSFISTQSVQSTF